MTARYRTVYTQAAERDLAALYDYLALEASRDVAERISEQIIERISALAQFPDRGSVPKEMRSTGDRTLRQVVVGKYRVLYFVADEEVVVFLIADGRRDMQALLRQRLLTPPDSPR